MHDLWVIARKPAGIRYSCTLALLFDSGYILCSVLEHYLFNGFYNECILN